MRTPTTGAADDARNVCIPMLRVNSGVCADHRYCCIAADDSLACPTTVRRALTSVLDEDLIFLFVVFLTIHIALQARRRPL
jgi:CxxC motif-containing protein (DUF1111 family)